MKEWAETKAKLERLSRALRLDGPPHGTAVPSEVRWAEHTLHELAHAYLLGWRVLRWPAFRAAQRPREVGYTVVIASTTNAGSPRYFSLLGLSARLGIRLGSKLRARFGYRAAEVADAHESCAVAVVHQILHRMAVAPTNALESWMTDVMNTQLISTHPEAWKKRTDAPGVLWCADAIVADLERIP